MNEYQSYPTQDPPDIPGVEDEQRPSLPDFPSLDQSNRGNSSSAVSLQPSVRVISPIIFLAIGLSLNVIATGVFNCSRTAHRHHAFYSLYRGILLTNIVGYLAIYPIRIAGHLNGLRWVGDQILCDFHGFAILNFGVCLSYLTGALAWERCLATIRPHTYEKKIERRKMPYVIGLLWVVGTFTSLLPLVGFGRFTLQYSNTFCFLDWRFEETVGRLFFSILATVISSILLLVVVSLSGSTAVAIHTFYKQRTKQVNNHSRPDLEGIVSNSTPNSGRPSNYSYRPFVDIQHKPHQKARQHLIWTTFQFFLVSTAFFVTFIPVVIRILFNVSDRQPNTWKDFKAVHRAEYYPICLPIIYIVFHKQLWMTLTRQKGKKQRYYHQQLLSIQNSHVSNNDIAMYRRYNSSYSHTNGSLRSQTSPQHIVKDMQENHLPQPVTRNNQGASGAKRRLHFPGRLVQMEKMYLPESEDSQHTTTVDARTETSLDSLLNIHTLSADSRSVSGSFGSFHDDMSFGSAPRYKNCENVNLTVLEKLMDSSDGYKAITSFVNIDRKESAI